MRRVQVIASLAGGLLFLPVTALGQASVMQPNSARECAVCHLDWVASFNNPDAVLLIERPDRSIVAAEDTCLGCHDGSVGDSRKSVWREHAHSRGVAPPASMTVPKSLPLNDGRLDCRTCHTAHAAGGPQTLETAIFLRTETTAEICVRCHTDAAQDPDHHPIVEPEAALARGVDPVGCQSCHVSHGVERAQLLRPTLTPDGLCLDCHEELANPNGPHPLFGDLVASAAPDAAARWREHVRVSETSCAQCHQMHHAPAALYQLNADLSDATFCVTCHADQQVVLDTPHDLRAAHPLAKNARGLAVQAGGPCLACHGVHQAALAVRPTVDDALGQCRGCHAEGGLAANGGGLHFRHPIGSEADLSCATCHDPHGMSRPAFLRNAPDQLCADCHTEQAMGLAGAHDLRGRRELQNAKGARAADVGACGFCHDVHDGQGAALWIATPRVPVQPDDLCAGCHRSGGLAKAEHQVPMHHPRAVASNMPGGTGGLPLFDADCRRSDGGVLSCATCHDPHRDSETWPSLLRRAAGKSTRDVCASCHTEIAHALPHGLHAVDALVEAGRIASRTPATTCGPCHATHGGQPMERGMWAGTWVEGMRSADEARCLGCHQPGSAAGPALIRDHAVINVGELAGIGLGKLPLEIDPDDPTREYITCSTCHEPHGGMPEIAGEGPAPLALRRAGKPMLRRFEMPNACTACHAEDALFRFLNFHRPLLGK